MATLAENPVVPPSYDQDIDSFLNLDQLGYTPTEQARSKIGLPTSHPALPGSEFVSSDTRSSSFAASQSPVAFPAPSHQYDEHKQQTGIPPGALAQAIPFNQVVPFGAPGSSFAVNGDMFQPQIKRDDAPLDFNSTPARNMSEMDLESDSIMATVPGFYTSQPNNSQFVDPSALGGQEVVPAMGSTQIGRMYPGMHQQAAMAKAAQQQRQHDLFRQQQQQGHLQQQPQPHHGHVSNATVDERISRLLQQMKSASGSPSDSSPSPSAAPLTRSKKDEQDMDEDERLLASEEGKKLSSKERRQLRNKVSARAFRSRRKEYIGQLENEVAQRTNEAQELRQQNRALCDENARLTDFVRQLLSSPSFAHYLDEQPNVSGLANNQMPLSHLPQQPQHPAISQPAMQQATPAKEPTPNHVQQGYQMQQQNSQMGMMMVPSQGIDVSTMNMNNAGWNSGIDFNPSMFAVLEVPQPPAVDAAALSGKSFGLDGASFARASSHKDTPSIPCSPYTKASGEELSTDAGDMNVEVDESDPILALFADQPKRSGSEIAQEPVFDGIESDKSAAFELVVENDSKTVELRFAHLCNSMEDAFQRVSMLTAHLQRPPKLEQPPFIPAIGVGNMKFYYQVLTTPTADTPGSSLLLHFPQKRYLFGQIAEGFQRSCTENGIKLTDVSDIFLSGRTGWDTHGGLIGTILTKADARASSAEALKMQELEKQANRMKHGNREQRDYEAEGPQHDLNVHGGRNLAHTLATARRFVFRKGLPVYTKEYDAESISKRLSTNPSDPFENPTFSDENIKVWALPISPFSTTSRSQSPRKRSLDEFREDTAGLAEVDQQAKEQLMRQSVVAAMFNSSWTLDSLEETRLGDVKIPAQIFVRNPETKDLDRYTGPLPGQDERVSDMTVYVRKPWPGAKTARIPTATPCDESLCYIVKSHDIRGRFDFQRAVGLNVKPGPDFGRLTRGETVTATDGKLVTPDMVLDPSKPGKGLAVLDLPTPEYVESLLNRPEWKSPAVASNLTTFYWILGPGVGDHPRLREFVASMPEVKHIVSSTDYCPNYLIMQSVATSAIRMAYLRSDNYKVPRWNNTVVPQSSSEDLMHVDNDKSLFQPAKPGIIVTMEPQFDLSTEEVRRGLIPHEILRTMPVSAVRRAAKIKSGLRHPLRNEKNQQYQKNLPGADVEIITLGTGSSAPSKYRNVSSTLLYVPNQGYYLLDCGEGTLGQLKRFFSPSKLQEVLKNLRLVWVSHLHADHHLGTVSVLKAWYQANYPSGLPRSSAIEMDMEKVLQEKRLFLVSDAMMVEWLEEYAGVEDFGFGKLVPLAAHPRRVEGGNLQTSFIYRHCRADGSFPGREDDNQKPRETECGFNSQAWKHTSKMLCEATGLSDLLTTYVSHCRGSMAVSLVFPNGFKVSFSGDCRPSPSFAAIGRDSTVLIHEATFSDDMMGSALAKKHSTAGEAIEIGRKMRARSILLTHFSQRYQKVAYFDQPEDLVYDKTVHGREFKARKAALRKLAADKAAAKAAKEIPTDIPPENDINTQEERPTDSPLDNDIEAHEERTTDTPLKNDLDAQEERLTDIPLKDDIEAQEEKLTDIPLEHDIEAQEDIAAEDPEAFDSEPETPPPSIRLFDILERASKLEQAQAREKRLREIQAIGKRKLLERARNWQIKQEKMSEEQRAQARAKRAERMSRSPSPIQSLSRSRSQSPANKHSIWDAPESEPGWTSSESESDNDSQTKQS
ncbi:hypothetical protein BDW74DRAFT_165247 [Aspergillus multicolor]|uniref:uncharacterized protein n=1 Tax=Aspergillus multicolor TaxID=41759 RepID=UPI003CCCBD99